MAFLTFRPRYVGGLEHSFPHMNAHSTANVIDGMHAFHTHPPALASMTWLPSRDSAIEVLKHISPTFTYAVHF